MQLPRNGDKNKLAEFRRQIFDHIKSAVVDNRCVLS